MQSKWHASQRRSLQTGKSILPLDLIYEDQWIVALRLSAVPRSETHVWRVCYSSRSLRGRS